MADIFGTGPRGCFSVVNVAAQGGNGGILALPVGGVMPSSQSDPFLVTSFRLSRNEVVSHNKTFGGRIYSYAFGNDPNSSALDISFTSFLGADIGGAAFGIIDGNYKDSRIYSSLALARFAIGSSPAVAGYVVNLSSNTVDPEHNLQDFSIRLALVDI